MYTGTMALAARIVPYYKSAVKFSGILYYISLVIMYQSFETPAPSTFIAEMELVVLSIGVEFGFSHVKMYVKCSLILRRLELVRGRE